MRQQVLDTDNDESDVNEADLDPRIPLEQTGTGVWRQTDLRPRKLLKDKEDETARWLRSHETEANN